MNHFKPIERWPEYDITNSGTVRKIATGRILKHTLLNNGYLIVTLYNGTVKKTELVHRLVAETWGHKQPGLQVNHKDGNKQHNHSDNLEWVTGSENQLHSFRVLGRIATVACKLSAEDVRELRADYAARNPARRWPRKKIAAKYGVSPSAISQCVAGETHIWG